MMVLQLTIVDTNGNHAYKHDFSMAGSNRDRAIEYAAKTVRRRWAQVAWFGSMLVAIETSGYWDFIAEITATNDPKVEVRKI